MRRGLSLVRACRRARSCGIDATSRGYVCAGARHAQDYVAAAAWYRRAVDHSSLAAVSSLATLYIYGFGVPQSHSAATRLLESAFAAAVLRRRTSSARCMRAE